MLGARFVAHYRARRRLYTVQATDCLRQMMFAE